MLPDSLGLNVCVNTQTPLLRFREPRLKLQNQIDKTTNFVDMQLLKEGVDFEFTAGGVTKMVLPLLTRLLESKAIGNAHWVCLNPDAPPAVRLNGITIHHVSMIRERTSGYGAAKENIWRAFHGLGQPPGGELWENDFVDYTYYNRVSAELMRSLDSKEDFDIFYIHDFQQLPAGHMLHTLKPKILRWHIPFDERMIPSEWEHYLSTYLNSYDAIIVSAKKYEASLKSFGYNGESFYVYPYVDQSAYCNSTQSDLIELTTKLNLDGHERIILVVARLDPMKGQDAAIKAMSKVVGAIDNVKLVVIGDGSFSSSKQGLGLSKSERWLMELRNLTKSLDIQENVIFTGYLPQRLLNAAYEKCDMTILPSRREGFGLVVVESWLYRKPAIVSSNAGIAELVEDGRNGMLVDPANSNDLSDKILTLLGDSALLRTLGENGFLTSRKCLISNGIRAEMEIVNKLV